MSFQKLFTEFYVVTDHENLNPTMRSDIVAVVPTLEDAAALVMSRNERFNEMYATNTGERDPYRAIPWSQWFTKGDNSVEWFLQSTSLKYHNVLNPMSDTPRFIRALDEYGGYRTMRQRLVKVLVGRKMRLRGITNTTYMSQGEYRRSMTKRKVLAQLFRDAVTACRQHCDGDIDIRDLHEAVEAFWNELNDYNRQRLYGRFFTYVTRIHRWVERYDLPVTMAACGHYEHDNEQTEVANGDFVCDNCLSDHYRDVDGEYHHVNDCYYWESDGEYHLAPEPDDDDDDDDGYVDRSELLQRWGASTGYLNHSSPNNSSQWTSDFTMGVELEVEATDSRYDSLRDCEDYFNGTPLGRYAMFKEDGSLSDTRGFEIVTAARTLPDHIDVFKRWRPTDLRAWAAGNCGMHVHIDSRAFSSLSIGKFLMLYNDRQNLEFIKAIAGRHPLTDSNAESYAAALGQTVNPVQVKKGASSTRYRMVNLTNLTRNEANRLGCDYDRNSKGSYSTVEVRIYRATLKKERLLAQLEFTHAAVMYCRVASWHELDGAHFKLWLAKTPGYPHLAAWLGVPVCRTTKTRKQVSQPATSEV